MFCLITGEKRVVRYERRPQCFILAATRLSSSTNGELLILNDTRGRFIALEAASLKVIGEFGGQEMPSAKMNQVTVLKSLSDDLLAAGYANGEVKVWDYNATEPKSTYHSQLVGTIGGVRCLELSPRHSLLFSGHEGSLENEHGRYFKVDHNLVRVIELNSVQVKTLEGVEDTCISLSVLDSKNFLLAGSSAENQVILWDFITAVKLMTIKVPQIGPVHAVVTNVFSQELDESQGVVVFGLSDGTALVSTLSVNTTTLSVNWQPLKLIQPKRKASVSERSIAYTRYETAFDILLLGDAQSELRLINNFLHECFPDLFKSAEVKIQVQDQSVQAQAEEEVKHSQEEVRHSQEEVKQSSEAPAEALEGN
jgi:hypothetical protein